MSPQRSCGKSAANKTPDELETYLSNMPDPVARLKRADLFKNGLASPYVQQAFATLRRTFADMEIALGDGAWITGATHGMSDVALVSYIDRLDLFGYAGLWAEKTPKVAAWLARMQARPSYHVAVSIPMGPYMLTAIRKGGEKHWPELERMWKA